MGKQTKKALSLGFLIAGCVLLWLLGFNPVRVAKYLNRKFECDQVRGQSSPKTEACIQEGWYSDEPSSW